MPAAPTDQEYFKQGLAQGAQARGIKSPQLPKLSLSRLQFPGAVNPAPVPSPSCRTLRAWEGADGDRCGTEQSSAALGGLAPTSSSEVIIHRAWVVNNFSLSPFQLFSVPALRWSRPGH